MAIKHTAPDFRFIRIAGAFACTEAVIDRLTSVIEQYLSDEMTTTFELKLSDGSSMSTDSVRDLHKLPFHNKKLLDKFNISYEGSMVGIWKPGVSVEITYRRYDDEPVRVAIHRVERGLELETTLKSLLEGERPWYSWIYKARILWIYLFGYGLWASCTLIAFAIKDERWLTIGAVCAQIGAIYWTIIVFSRNILFDKASVLFGEEIARQERRQRVRQLIFGTIGIGLGLAIIGGLAAGYFNGVFAHIGDQPAATNAIGGNAMPARPR